MGIFDKAKEALSDHPEQVDKGIDKLGDLADEKTGGKYADKVDQGQDLARDRLGHDPAVPVDPTPPA
jgi:hypothetical protein